MSLVSSNNPAWRKSLLHQLQARNRQTSEPYESVIQTCVSLFEKIDSLQREKFSTGDSVSGSSPSLSSNITTERVATLQNDLKELQKNCQEKETTINELNSKITNLMKEKNELKSKNSDLLINIDGLNVKCQAYEDVIKELKDQNNLLTDELTSQQLLYKSLENKYQDLSKQYNELVSRWLALKAKDAEIMNEENEKMIRLQQEKASKQLEESANKMTVGSNVNKEMSGGPINEEEQIFFVVPQRQCFNFEAHNEIYSLKFDKRTQNLTTCGGDRKVKIWNLNDMTANLVETLSGSNQSVTSIDIFEECLVASSNDHASRVWTLNDFKLRRTLTGHSNKVMSVKFLNVNNKVVSASSDKTLKIWDLNRNACMKTLFAGSSCTDVVNINENFVISSHFDKKIRFWDTRSEQPSTDTLLQGKVTSLEITNNNNYLLCAVRTVNRLSCFDLRMNQIVRDYTDETFVVGCDWTRTKLSPEDRTVACGSADGSIYFWDFSTGKFEHSLKSDRHNAPVVAVEWHPKGKMFISADRNKNIVVWH